jgi:hypothetical protein
MASTPVVAVHDLKGSPSVMAIPLRHSQCTAERDGIAGCSS